MPNPTMNTQDAVSALLLSRRISAACMQPDSQRGSVERLHSLCEKPCNHSRQHVPGAPLGHPRISGPVDPHMAVRPGGHRAVALEHHGVAFRLGAVRGPDRLDEGVEVLGGRQERPPDGDGVEPVPAPLHLLHHVVVLDAVHHERGLDHHGPVALVGQPVQGGIDEVDVDAPLLEDPYHRTAGERPPDIPSGEGFCDVPLDGADGLLAGVIVARPVAGDEDGLLFRHVSWIYAPP